MGLDTFAGRYPRLVVDDDEEFGCRPEDLAAFRRAERRCERRWGGCLFGENYLRGKLFDQLVRQVTGQTLYREWIDPDTVGRMAAAFDRSDPHAVIAAVEREGAVYEHGPEVVLQLREFLRVCADRGLGLVGSW